MWNFLPKQEQFFKHIVNVLENEHAVEIEQAVEIEHHNFFLKCSISTALTLKRAILFYFV